MSWRADCRTRTRRAAHATPRARARRVACVVCGGRCRWRCRWPPGGPRCRRVTRLRTALRGAAFPFGSVRSSGLYVYPRWAAARRCVCGECRARSAGCSVVFCSATLSLDVRCIYIEQRAARTTNTHGHIATVVWPRMRMLVRGKYTPHARATRQVVGRREAGSHSPARYR